MPITVEHHATLFAYVAREACARFGDAGEAAVLEGVRRYGERRGRRMAEAARGHGYGNDMAGFLLFGELDFAATGNVSHIEQEEPYVVSTASRCGWCNAWQAGGVLDYGRLYCREIDAAVMRGFNPEYRFAVEGTMSNGDTLCRFLYPDALLGPEERERLAAGRERLGGANLRPFSFHTAELLRVLGTVLEVRFGGAGRQAVEAAMLVFAAEYGDEAATAVQAAAAAMTD
ncbi:MAG: L-2-amino-thiazoline-4-carboxylic acid hydrolase [Anaerolineae bacterium]